MSGERAVKLAFKRSIVTTVDGESRRIYFLNQPEKEGVRLALVVGDKFNNGRRTVHVVDIDSVDSKKRTDMYVFSSGFYKRKAARRAAREFEMRSGKIIRKQTVFGV